MCLLIKALIPFVRALHSWPNHFPEAPPAYTCLLRTRTSAYELGGVGVKRGQKHSVHTSALQVSVQWAPPQCGRPWPLSLALPSLWPTQHLPWSVVINYLIALFICFCILGLPIGIELPGRQRSYWACSLSIDVFTDQCLFYSRHTWSPFWWMRADSRERAGRT